MNVLIEPGSVAHASTLGFYVSTPCNNCLVLASVTVCERTQRKAGIEEPRQSQKAVKEVGGSWGSRKAEKQRGAGRGIS